MLFELKRAGGPRNERISFRAREDLHLDILKSICSNGELLFDSIHGSDGGDE